MMPFLKHILDWDDGTGGRKKAIYGEEGFTHGPSAALRGFDMRMFWDASTLKVVGAVRFSFAAAIAWQREGGEAHTHSAVGAQSWAVAQVPCLHG